MLAELLEWLQRHAPHLVEELWEWFEHHYPEHCHHKHVTINVPVSLTLTVVDK